MNRMPDDTSDLHPRSPRRSALTLGLAAAALALGMAAPLAGAQALPPGPIKIVIGFPPAGPADIVSRLLADKMQTTLKRTVVVENRAGAGGNLAADQVARAAADGTTILSGIDTTFTINPSIYKSMPFKLEELKPLMVMASSGLLLGAHPSLGAKTLKALLDKGKTTPLNFSSGSNGSPGHLAAAMLSEATGVQLTHIPYKGNAPAVMAVLSGEVQAGALATPGMLPHVQAGKIVPLAVTSRKRSPLAPDVPTAAEAGVKELQLEILYVTMVPVATPEPVMEVLRKAMTEALAQPDVRAQLTKLDMLIEGVTGKAAEDLLREQRERYDRIIQATGMKVE